MMNKIFYALVACIVLASCSSSYRSSQTPDDVYYSPGKNKTVATAQSGQDDYLTYDDEDDNYLRMKVQNRNRWSSLDDYSYWNSPYYSSYYGMSYGGYYSPYAYSPYSSFGYSPYSYSPFSLSMFYSPFAYNYYNPWGSYYYMPTYVYYGKPGSNGYIARPQNRSSLNGYTNRNYNNGNATLPVRSGRRSGLTTNGSNPYNSYSNQGNRSNYNNTNSNRSNNSNSSNISRSNNNSSNSNPVRTFNNSNSGSVRSSGGSSGGGGSVSRPVRH